MIQANAGPSYPTILKLPRSEFYDDLSGLSKDWFKSILQLVNALKHCESQGVLHCDVKPENILNSTDTLDIKLFDFGCGDFLRKSAYKEFAGTLEYAPPEWFIHKRYHAGPVTVWSVGVTLYEIVCNELSFKTTENQLVFQSYLSEDCKDLIGWCLSTNPNDQYSLEDIEHHPWFS